MVNSLPQGITIKKELDLNYKDAVIDKQAKRKKEMIE